MPVPHDARLEVEQRVAEALARFGVAGKIEIGGDKATLYGHGPTVSVDCRSLVEEWEGLGLDWRERRANEIARRLAQQRRELVAPPPPRQSISWSDWLLRLGVLALAVTGVFGAYHLYRWRTAGAEAEAETLPEIEAIEAYERKREQRAERVCEAAESRVMRGAAVGPADVEGWVAELSMLSTRELFRADDERLAAFLAPVETEGFRRIAWPGSKVLLEASGPRTKALILDGDVQSGSASAWHGVRIVFTGRYVVPYFHEKQRIELIRFARALAEGTEADYAALYARCAHARAHHMGSWFFGPSPGGAVASLLYFMGTYARALHVRGSVLRPRGGEVDRAHAFRRIASATAPLDKERVLTMLAPSGGMIAGGSDGPFAIRFPFLDANRAARASRAIARELGIGVHR